MKDRGIRKGILTILQKDSWDKLLEEVQHAAPNLFSILSGALHVHASPCVERRRANASSQRVRSSAILGFCTAILCRYRNQSMNLVQRILSILLYNNGASKRV